MRHVVVCLRQPAAVLASLARRDHLPRWLAAHFYAYHLRALLQQLPPQRTVFVDVDRLAAGAHDELDQLRGRLGLDAAVDTAALLRDVVRREHLAAAGDARCPAGVESLWQRLQSLAAAARSAAAAASEAAE